MGVSQTFLETNLMKLENLVSLHITECRQINLNSLYHKKSLKGVLSNLKSFTLPVVTRIQGYSSFESILKRCPRLEEVGYDGDLPLRFFFTCPSMILARLCPNLQRLKLGPEWVKKKNVWRDALEVLDVKALDLDMRPLHPPGLGPSVEENIMYIADVLPKLERLNLFCKGRISVDGIITLVKKLKNLKHFDISQVYFSFDSDRRKIFYELSKMSQLETLKLDFLESITAELIYTLVEGLSNLKHLELGDVGSIRPEYADLIGGQLQKLRSFKVTVSPYGGSGIGALCGKLPNLTDLTIKHGGLTNGGLVEMSSGVTQSQLKSLNVAGSQKINDQGITCIANTFKSLTCLDITSCSVSDSGLAVIAEQMNQLERLSVTGRKVTNYGGVMIGKHLKRLEHLKISGTKIGDQGFAFICHQLQRLHTLQAFCDMVTDQGFQDGVRGLGKLITLQIGSHNIRSKEFLDALVHLKSVVQLTIRAITVRDDGIQRMIKEMPLLSKLSIHCCNHFRSLEDDV